MAVEAVAVAVEAVAVAVETVAVAAAEEEAMEAVAVVSDGSGGS